MISTIGVAFNIAIYKKVRIIFIKYSYIAYFIFLKKSFKNIIKKIKI